MTVIPSRPLIRESKNESVSASQASPAASRFWKWWGATAFPVAAGIGAAVTIAGLCRQSPAIAAFGLLLGFTARRETLMEQSRTLQRGVTVEDAMERQYRTLAVSDDMHLATHLIESFRQEHFPVIYADEPVGLLSRNAIQRTVAETGGDTLVTEVMSKDLEVLQVTDPLESGLRLLRKTGGVPVLILRGDELAGILTGESVRQFLG